MPYLTYSATAKSLYHEKTEDAYNVGDNYIIIADGMGGECNGDVASKIAVETILNILKAKSIETLTTEEIQKLMFTAIAEADRHILNYINQNPESYGMGTTILLLLYVHSTLYLAWCGDSRCFIYRKGILKSLTKDHSYVQELIDRKEITVEESYTHQDNNLITRYVGGGEDTCRPEFTSVVWQPEDIIILCSDGLSGYCRDEAICKKISFNTDMPNLPKELMELAIQQGSDDDITIVILCQNETALKTNSSSLFKWFKRMISTTD